VVEAYDPGSLVGSVVGFPLRAGWFVAVNDGSTGSFGLEWDNGSQYIRFTNGLRCVAYRHDSDIGIQESEVCRTGGLLNLLDNGNDFAILTWENTSSVQPNGQYNQSGRIKVYDSTGFAVLNIPLAVNIGITQSVLNPGTGSYTSPVALPVTEFRLAWSGNSWQDAGYDGYTISDIQAADFARAARKNLTTY